MQALRWHARTVVTLDEVPEPSAGPGEVVVRVEACGICGSDLHEYLHGPLYIPTAPHPLTGVAPRSPSATSSAAGSRPAGAGPATSAPATT